MTACASTTMNLAPSADNAEKRSLKSGLLGISAFHALGLGDHIPRSSEDAFRAYELPEVQVEGAVVGLPPTKDARHPDRRPLHRAQSYQTSAVETAATSAG